VTGGAVSQSLDYLDRGPVTFYLGVAYALDPDVTPHHRRGPYHLLEIIETFPFVSLLGMHEPRLAGATAIDGF